MADRDKILRYFKASGDEELAARLVDLAEAARKTARYKVSEFLDPHGRNVADIVAANFEGIRLESDGGFANAERSRIAFVAEDFTVHRILDWSAISFPGISGIIH